MGNKCPCLCPRRNKRESTSYDVHQETFEMDQNIDSMNIEELSPNNVQVHDTSSETQFVEEQIKRANGTINKSAHYQDQQSQYVQRKNKSTMDGLKSDAMLKESKQLNDIDDQMISSTKQMHPDQPLLAKSSQLLNSQAQEKPQAQPQKPKTTTQEPPKQEKKSNPHILKPKTAKKKVNLDDYRYKQQKGQFKVKKIDSIKCQQYNIDKCNNSEYFIFDVTANVYIDNTNDCKIFIAPCESTIFVRNCKNLTIVAATKQFRTFECHNCTFSLLCKSQPVIQSSSNLIFAPFQMPNYQQLKKQLDTLKLQIWNNHWSEIHNFTKKQGEVHYQLKRNINQKLMNWQKAFQMAQMKQIQGNIVPFVQGQLPLQENQSDLQEALILFNEETSKNDFEILQILTNSKLLNSFKGPVTGFGKALRVAVLFAYLDEQVPNKEKLQNSGQLFLSKQDVQKYKNQIFVNFGDVREK